jgi:hypothetical protein|tara:strand:- start:6093 stop:7085 length:993 start_codon:yes stop_codon:yes gene_type:complete
MYDQEVAIENVMQRIHNQSFEKWVDNFSKNLPNIWKENSAKKLKQNKKNKNSAIVIGRGPSLIKKNHLKILADSDYSGSIICTDGILKDVLNAGVTPNKFKKIFVVTIDPHEKIRKFYDDKIIDEFGGNIEGIFTTITDPTTVERARNAGIKINWIHSLFDLDKGKKSFNYISSLMVRAKNHNEGLPAIQTGGNVGTSAWFVGWRILDCQTIALIGINHSWEETDPIELIMKHGVVGKDIDIDKDSPEFQRLFPKMYNPELKKNFILDPLFQFYRKGLIEFIQRSPTYLTTINATEGGSIFGDRILSMPFKQFLKREIENRNSFNIIERN